MRRRPGCTRHARVLVRLIGLLVARSLVAGLPVLVIGIFFIELGCCSVAASARGCPYPHTCGCAPALYVLPRRRLRLHCFYDCALARTHLRSSCSP